MLTISNIFVIIYFSVLTICLCDVYLHNPPGSNNRLNEESATRRNADRMFDSQNNNRGGYNKGDATNERAQSNRDDQYDLKFFQSNKEEGKTYLDIEWTNQHGAGVENEKLNSDIILQYMCGPNEFSEDTQVERHIKKLYYLRDGYNTNRQNFNNNNKKNAEKFFEQIRYLVQENSGLHEPYENYQACTTRRRNKGLFTADQNVKQDRATHTRQNPNGNRRGYECPEERDYYPYWHPTPWKDIAILTSKPEKCDYYRSESFNVKPKHMCVDEQVNGQNRIFAESNTEQECNEAGGTWAEFHNYCDIRRDLVTEEACNNANDNNLVWGRIFHYEERYACLVKLPPPDCQHADFSRVNHLGNTKDLLMMKYRWVLPDCINNGEDRRAVIRIRYNISTADYDPENTFSDYNADNPDGNEELITNDPKVDIGAKIDFLETPLQLAINTAQTGRTFQDRTHVFILRSRDVIADSEQQRKDIYNMNVRGKRGNIVQVYPAVEYDFTPNSLTMGVGDLLHMQWTGSNTHKNNGNGGDGQTGDAGEGDEGTDRHNCLSLVNRDLNYPMVWENDESNLFKHVTQVLTANQINGENEQNENLSQQDLAIQFASSGYYQCVQEATCEGESVETKSKLDSKLNHAPASFAGALMQIEAGTYNIICTRNNNFSNRSQKGTIIVNNNA